MLEMGNIAGREPPAVDAGNRGDHAVHRLHPAATTSRVAHHFAVDERCFLGEREDPTREATSPLSKTE